VPTSATATPSAPFRPQFLEAFGGVLGKNLTHEQLTHLFMKIDANSDGARAAREPAPPSAKHPTRSGADRGRRAAGSVDWDEFTNFMLLENQAAADMSDRSYQVRYVEQDPKLSDPNPKSAQASARPRPLHARAPSHQQPRTHAPPLLQFPPRASMRGPG